MKGLVSLWVAATVLTGCSRLAETESSGSKEAGQLFDHARMLEASGKLREASGEYLYIAEQFSDAEVWPQAVLKTGVLYGSPQNPARSDSVARRWLGVYAVLTTDDAEQQLLRLASGLLESQAGLQRQIDAQRKSIDSLAAVSRRLSASVAAQSRLAEDLEQQLRKTSDELKKLKEIDLQTSRKRQRR
jgi:outer membrane protein assembly factor BamD (BamD/ComL family)